MGYCTLYSSDFSREAEPVEGISTPPSAGMPGGARNFHRTEPPSCYAYVPLLKEEGCCIAEGPHSVHVFVTSASIVNSAAVGT